MADAILQVAAIFKNLPIENIVYKYQKEVTGLLLSGGKDGCAPFVNLFGGNRGNADYPRTYPKTTQDIILDKIRNNPKITREKLAALIGISPDTVYHLRRLTEQNHRTGRAAFGVWRLKAQKYIEPGTQVPVLFFCTLRKGSRFIFLLIKRRFYL